MCCFIFCFESVLNRPPHPRCQEQIKGLFFLIAKIVIPGNESVKTCLHKIAVAKSVLNEMRGKSPELSKEVRWFSQITTAKTFASRVKMPSYIPGRRYFRKYLFNKPIWDEKKWPQFLCYALDWELRVYLPLESVLSCDCFINRRQLKWHLPMWI